MHPIGEIAIIGISLRAAASRLVRKRRPSMLACRTRRISQPENTHSPIFIFSKGYGVKPHG